MEQIKLMMKRFKAEMLSGRLAGWLASSREHLLREQERKGVNTLNLNRKEQSLGRFRHIMRQMRHGRVSKLLHVWAETCSCSLRKQAEEMQERLLRYQSQTEALDRFKMTMARVMRQQLTAVMRVWHGRTADHKEEMRLKALHEVASLWPNA